MSRFVMTKDIDGKEVLINLDQLEGARKSGDEWNFYSSKSNVILADNQANQIIHLMRCDVVM